MAAKLVPASFQPTGCGRNRARTKWHVRARGQLPYRCGPAREQSGIASLALNSAAKHPHRAVPPWRLLALASAMPTERKTYAVTGGTGFLGEHLVQQLLEQGHAVRLLSRSGVGPSSLTAEQQHNVEVVPGSVEDPASLARLMAPGDGGPVAGVFHLAGVVEHSLRREALMRHVTVDGTLNVLSASKQAGVRRVVYASTSGTVAVSPDPAYVADDASPYATQVTQPWPYYRYKIEAEREARRFAAESRVELICMRPTLLLGPGDRRLSSCRSVADLLSRRIPLMPSGGLSFVDVRDTASAFLVAMEKGRPGATYLLGAQNLTLSSFFHTVGGMAGVPPPRLRIPAPLALLLASLVSRLFGLFGFWDPSLDPVLVSMSQHYWYLDCRRAQVELGFVARSPEETIKDTVEWLQQHRSELQH